MYSVGEFSKLINRSVNTLQRWDRDGVLVAKRTKTNRRYYTEEQLLEYKGIKASEKSKVYAYVRVSLNNQKDDLNNQAQMCVQN